MFRRIVSYASRPSNGAAVFALLLVATACNSDESSPCEPGSLGCACTAEGRCAEGLECLSNRCVVEGGFGGDSGEQPPPSGPTDSGPAQPDGSQSDAAPPVIDGGDVSPEPTCDELDPPSDGSVVLEGRSAGDVAHYECNSGLGLVGVASRTCGTDGNWTDEAPECAPGDCPTLDSPADGTVTTPDGTPVGAEAIYACNAGFERTGEATRTCQEDNSWSGGEPTCDRIDCGALGAPDNGDVDVPDGTLYEMIATYTCEAGYNMSGEATRTCQADGSWSGSEPSCVALDCGTVAAPQHGTVATPGGTTFGQVADYACSSGYGLVGFASRVCAADGNWSDSAPTCEPGDCANLTSPANGSVETPNGTIFGAVATYSCHAGYNLTGGNTTRTCGAGPMWSGSAPSCQVVDCGAPSSPTNGSVSTPGGTTFGDTASYGCNPGYYRSGSATATCGANGSWSPSAPSCVDANTEGLRLTQLRVGTSEFVRIRNTHASAVATLTGARIEFRDSSNTYTYDFTGGTLSAGSTATVGEAGGPYAVSLDLAGSRAATIVLCSGSPCTASSVLDAFVYEGGTTAPALPPGVGFDTPLWGIHSMNDNDEDFYRIDYDGSAPTFTRCDWSAAGGQPDFVESFECGLSGWTLNGNSLVADTDNPSPDGSAHSGLVTAIGSNGIQRPLAGPLFPTHLDLWTYGSGFGSFMRFCFDAACSSGEVATVYWVTATTVCALNGSTDTGACATVPAGEWAFVEIDGLSWTQGTGTVRINGANDATLRMTGWSAGLNGIGLASTGQWDGIRVW
jgi:hypothetical protein